MRASCGRAATSSAVGGIGVGKVERFEDFLAWQRARDLAKAINLLVEEPTFARRYAFRDQLQRAAVSVMSNIAEGFERGSRAEFHHGLLIAKGSSAEVRSMLYVALDAHYIDEATFDRLMNQASEVSRLIGGLRASVARQRDSDRQGGG